MSIISALYAGVSGMNAMSKGLQVTSNNIANINTVGFKGSRAEFADILSLAINTPAGKSQLGRGVRLQAVEGLFHQGSFENTPLVTDLAINGAGYFVVSDATDTFYTRAGQFRIDKDGNLVNALGMNVNGYAIEPTGQRSGTRGPINLSSVTAPPNPTGDGSVEGSGIYINLNLDPRDGVKTFDITKPTDASSCNYSTAVTVYDSLGGAHTTLICLNMTADNTWAWHAVVDGGELTGGTAGVFQEQASGTLAFDTNGHLTTQTTTTSAFNFKGGTAQNQAIGLNFTGTTQTMSSSSVNSLRQDGFAAGSLQAIDIDREGVITGVFSNGASRPVAQLSIASFAAENNLFRTGNSLFAETPESGQPIYSVANTGSNGTVAANTLELSNVDLTEEFVNLITTERAFQANTKVVTTGDSMLETVINMKR
jgi:flagellar hook protein FlgE